jgi:enediyne biosynthesis thioesterase
VRQYHHRHVVTLDETNLVGNVYFAQHLHWQGHCREHFLADHAPEVLKALTSTDLVLVTLACEMDYYAECFALDEIDVGMSLRRHGGNRIGMEFDFRRDGQQIARGSQTVACMRRTSDGVAQTPIPAELEAALTPFA